MNYDWGAWGAGVEKIEEVMGTLRVNGRGPLWLARAWPAKAGHPEAGRKISCFGKSKDEAIYKLRGLVEAEFFE